MSYIKRITKRIRGKFTKYNIKVIDNSNSLLKILDNNLSVVRFGDGEFDLLRGSNIPYQNYDKKLALQMKKIILEGTNSRLLVCLPDIFKEMDRYNKNCRDFYYESFFYQNKKILHEIENTDNIYGSTFISRPYIDLKDKKGVDKYFASLKQLWNKKDILIVEGKYTRSGENNDLFDNTKSVKRIICPSKNAYSYLDRIEHSIVKNGSNKLVLLMLGPTAKIIVNDLYNVFPAQLIDLGHIDSEYEWFKMGATKKVKIPNKHTAEFNNDDDMVKLECDSKFDSEIVDQICL